MQKTAQENDKAYKYYLAGISALKKEEFTIACKLLNKSITLNPKSVITWYNLALSYKKLKNTTKAIQTFQKVQKMQPKNAACEFHLGCLFMQTNNFSASIQHFENTLDIWPTHPESLTNIASCYLQKNELQKAKKFYEKAQKIMPNDTQILFNLGIINTKIGNADLAIKNYRYAIHIDQNLFAAHYNLALLFLTKKEINFALESLKTAQQLQPNNETIKHLINSINQNPNIKTAPEKHLTELFDNYANHYEEHLLNSLDYQIPFLFSQEIKKTFPKLKNARVLDLGCGTGLCGVQFSKISKHIHGVDLSAKMLIEARKKNVYQELTEAEIHKFLEKNKSTFDLILAGDVVVYMGDLHSLLQLIHINLQSNGIFIFNTELNTSNKNYKLQPSGRFSHSRKYIDNLATEYNFKLIIKEINSRLQQKKLLAGLLCILQK